MRDVDSGIHYVIILTRPSHTASDNCCGGELGTRQLKRKRPQSDMHT